MKKLNWFLFLVTLLLFTVTTSHANSFSFSDNTIYWETWGNGSDDTTDSIGSPNIVGGGGVVLDTNGNLDEVCFNYLYYNSAVKSGDLFIDVGSDKDWDYVVTTGGELYHFNDGVFGLDSVSNYGKYILSDDTFGVNYSGYNYREGHPVFANINAFNQNDYTVTTGNFYVPYDGNISTPIKFTNLNIDLQGQSFIIGWAPTCANDVVYEQIPEPTQMILLGTSLLGLAGFGRKKYLK